LHRAKLGRCIDAQGRHPRHWGPRVGGARTQRPSAAPRRRVVRIALRDKPGYVSNMKWWDWLGTLPQGQATFLGSFVGLFALLVAALVNAHLNRRRDDRLRAEERRSVGTALRAELAGFKDTLVENSETLSHAQEDHGAFFLLPELARSIRIWPHMIPKLGIFDQETIGRVTDAYLVMEQYGERLLLLGGRLVDPTGAAVGRRATTETAKPEPVGDADSLPCRQGSRERCRR